MRGSVPGPSKSADRAYGTDFFMLTLWDMSLARGKNDRIAKLGVGGGSRAIAIAAFDVETNRMTLADGVFHPLASRARMEPDNYVFLDHGGLDKVWAHRDIADHENPSTSIKHRSDIVVNQKGRMCWGYKQDMQWVVEIEEVGAPIPKGREFDGAGFIGGKRGGPSISGAPSIGIGSANSLMGNAFKLKEGGPIGMLPVRLTGITKEIKDAQRKDVATGGGGQKRAVVAFNNNMRGGYYTDGNHVAQLRQLFHMMPLKPPKPKEPKRESEDGSYEEQVKKAQRSQGLGGYQQFGKNPGQIDEPVNKTEGMRDRDQHTPDETVVMEKSGGEDSDCMVDRWVGALRGDVIFDVLGDASHLAFVDVDAAMGDDAYYGAFMLLDPAPRGPKYVPAEDQSSDQPILEAPQQKSGQKGIRPWIKIPKQTGTPPQCEPQFHFDPISPSYGTTGVIPPAHTGSGADAGEWLPPLPLVDRNMAVYEFPPGKLTSTGGRAVIPSTMMDMRVAFEVPYTLPVNLTSGQQMNFRFFYKVVLGPGQSAPTTWNEIKAAVTIGDNPMNPDQVKCIRFEIPRLNIGRASPGGGSVHFRFMRRSDDTASNRKFWLVGNIQYSFSPANSARRPVYGGYA